MTDRFHACLKETLKWEGGWSNHKHDPGGATMKGVIQRVYDAWREKNGKPRQSVRNITDDEVEAIYRENYWRLVRGDELPPGVDLAVFDFGVNSGPSRSIRYLQTVLKVKADGIIGPITIKAATDADSLETVKALMAARRKFLNQIPYKQYFIKGWMRRCDGVEQACIEACGLAIKDAPLAPIADPDVQSETQGKADHEPQPTSPATVATLGTAGGAALANVVPSPPPEMTETVTQLTNWQTIISMGQSAIMFGVEHWPWVLAGIGTFAGLTYWHRRATS